MIDFSLEIKKTQPINIKEMELNRYKIDNDIKKSIILYNTAIGEIRKENFDLAANDLKKSLAYNKGFPDAIKLMGLCYANMNDYKNAEKIFKRLEKYTLYSELAYEYVDSLKISKSMFKNMKQITNGSNYDNNRSKFHSSKSKSSLGKLITALFFVIVIVSGLGINYFYPQTMQEVLAKLPINIQGLLSKVHSNSVAVVEEEKDKSQSNINNLEEDSTVTSEAVINVQKKLEDVKTQVDNSKIKTDTLNILNDAENSTKNGDYEKAANALISLKDNEFDQDSKVKFDSLWQEIKIRGLWPIYNDGNKLYKQKKYVEALPKLKVASEIDPNVYLMPWITYQIGTCYKETNNKVEALVYFKQVKDNYPKSQYASNAQMMINEIGN